VMRRSLEAFSKLDILVNNAGVGPRTASEDVTLEQWEWVISINLTGVFLGTKYGIEAMKPRGGGSIVNISSIQGLVGDPIQAAYNASKGGVRLFTKFSGIALWESRV